jgi:hypothetical protein
MVLLVALCYQSTTCIGDKGHRRLELPLTLAHMEHPDVGPILWTPIRRLLQLSNNELLLTTP